MITMSECRHRDKGLPLALKAWAAKQTEAGGKGGGARRFRAHAPLPQASVRFAAQAFKARESTDASAPNLVTP
jgi:hypothetical protein